LSFTQLQLENGFELPELQLAEARFASYIVRSRDGVYGKVVPMKYGVALLLLLIASSVRADILVLQTGKTLKIQSYTIEGATMRADLNDKGEIAIPVAWVSEIRPSPPEPKPVPAAIVPSKTENLEFAFSDLVRSCSKKHEMDSRLVFAVMAAESNFNPHAFSPKGALGLMQLMPDTARLYHVNNPYDPAENIEAGVRHLKMLLRYYNGKLDLVLAAYNAGMNVVDRYQGIPPYQETKEYVKRVLQLYKGLSRNI
jgi:Soluble lytic murein transglycosylase and related regulatory proteins (some contain LysM/invasin domains)